MKFEILNTRDYVDESLPLWVFVGKNDLNAKSKNLTDIDNSFIQNAIILVFVLFLPGGLFGQNTESVLAEIEINNTALSAYRNFNEAQKLENKTGIYPGNPEIEFNYLWGDPSAMGTRKDFAITQSIDFPTAYGIRKKIADAKNIQSDLDYELQRKFVLYKAKKVCFELIYLNALNDILTKRALHAADIAVAYIKKFEIGEVNILDKNKAQFNLLNARKELEFNKVERNRLLAELAALNGGNPVSFEQRIFSEVNLPLNFESWYSEYEAKNIVIQQANNEIILSQKRIKLSKALSLPKLSGGYMSESVVGESFRGISVGMSIPLWENKNSTKLATAKQQVALEHAKDKKIQTYSQLKGQYEKAVSLQKLLASYREELKSVNSADLLKKALDSGELSLIGYLLELTMYYETTDKFLSVENELNQLAAGLYFFEL